jgi:hypothetical protein
VAAVENIGQHVAFEAAAAAILPALTDSAAQSRTQTAALVRGHGSAT